MYSRILIPLDGSHLAEQVLPWAQWIAQRFKARAILFHGIKPGQDLLFAPGPPPADEPAEGERAQAREYLQKIAADFTRAGLESACELRAGAPAAAILDFAERERIDLIAMATHGRTGLQRWVFGSVADKVLNRTHVPLLLVRVGEAPARPAGARRILVPLDGSRLSEEVLRHAQALALGFDAELLLFAVWEEWGYRLGMNPGSDLEERMQEAHALARNYLLTVTHALQAQGVRARWLLQTGLVADCILDAVKANGVDLITMSTHGRSGIDRWVMGSVADRVVSAAPVPVLLVRPEGARRLLDEPALRL